MLRRDDVDRTAGELRLQDARAGPRMVRGAADSADCGDTRRYRPGARQPVHAPETCERVRVSLQVRLLTE